MPAPLQIRRFYFELVRHRRDGRPDPPLEVLAAPAFRPVLEALGEADLPVRIAALVLLPEDDEGRARVVQQARRARSALRAYRVGLDIWPQLDDDAHRFLNLSSAPVFAPQLLALLDVFAASGPVDVGVALDLEPPGPLLDIGWTLTRPLERPLTTFLVPWRALGATARGLAAAERGRGALEGLADALADRRLPVHVAVLPPLVPGRGPMRWRESVLGVPLFRAGSSSLLFEDVAPMCYRTLIQPATGKGAARAGRVLDGWLRDHARWCAGHRATRRCVLGLTSEGVVGSEPVYTTLRDLISDLAAAEAQGYEDIAVFSLEGIVYGATGAPGPDLAPLRPDWREWIDVICARRPPLSVD